MDKRTLTALKGSIAKWQAIVDGTGVDRGYSNCPLCRQFYPLGYGCEGCPVYARTRIRNCGATPYDDWIFAWRFATECADPAFIIDDATERAAKAELAFLQSLLPEEA